MALIYELFVHPSFLSIKITLPQFTPQLYQKFTVNYFYLQFNRLLIAVESWEAFERFERVLPHESPEAPPGLTIRPDKWGTIGQVGAEV